MITTIACPISMSHPDISDTSPVWVDAMGNEYRVASGIIGGRKATKKTVASPDAITILIGLPGIEALHSMGLSAKEADA